MFEWMEWLFLIEHHHRNPFRKQIVQAFFPRLLLRANIPWNIFRSNGITFFCRYKIIQSNWYPFEFISPWIRIDSLRVCECSICRHTSFYRWREIDKNVQSIGDSKNTRSICLYEKEREHFDIGECTLNDKDSSLSETAKGLRESLFALWCTLQMEMKMNIVINTIAFHISTRYMVVVDCAHSHNLM